MDETHTVLCSCGSGHPYRDCCLNGTLMSAYELMQEGELSRAENLCSHALEGEPDHADALHLAGMVQHRLRNYGRAMELMKRSIVLFPHQAAFLCNLGDVYRDMGLPEETVSCYERAVDLDPGNAEAFNNLGVNLGNLGRSEEAVASLRRAVCLNPGFAAAHYNLGDALKTLNRLDDAWASYRTAVAIDPLLAERLRRSGDELSAAGMHEEAAHWFRRLVSVRPDLVAAHVALGVACYESGRLDEAAAGYRRAIELDPACLRAWSNLGTALYYRGLPEEAEACYRKVLARKPAGPDHVSAYVGLGLILAEEGRPKEAADSCRRALELDPACIWAHNNLGNVLNDQGEVAAAIGCYRRALELKPDFAGAHDNLGNALKNAGRLDEAIACYEQALAIDPGHLTAHDNLLMACLYHPDLTHDDIWARSVEFGRRVEEARQPARLRFEGAPRRGGRIRIGLVSGDLKKHPVGYFLESLLRTMDRECFDIIAYANQSRYDEVSERISSSLSDWVRVKGVSDAELAARIRGDGIQILIDLSGHTAFNRLPLFALRPAPVQVSWLGYPNTTGMRSIDYIIADPITVPVEEERFYTEKVWRLPESYLCFTPPDVDVAVDVLPALKNGHITFGCFNNPSKLNDSVIACWAKILGAVPGSQLFLKYLRYFNDSPNRESLANRFAAYNIEPERLKFEGDSSREGLFAAYNHVDVALDTFPYNGVTTTCEAAWMGVPTLTLRMARGIVGHNGELIMKMVGLDDWVACSMDEYVELGAGFARDTAELTHIRSVLRGRLLGSPLCDGKRFAKHLGDAFLGMLGQYAIRREGGYAWRGEEP